MKTRPKTAKPTKAPKTPAPALPPPEVVDGCEYRNLTDAGRARLKARPTFGAATPLRPWPALHAPKPARDRSVEAWAARLGAVLTKRMTKDDKRARRAATLEDIIGRPVGGGFYVVATDGNRALCRKGPGDKPAAPKAIAEQTSTAQWFEASDDLALALRRMKAAGSDKTPSTTVDVCAKTSRVTVSTADLEDGTTAREWMPATLGSSTGKAKAVSALVNTVWFLEALGVAGLRIYLSPDSPIMFDTPDGEYRLLLMPMQAAAARPKTTRATTWHPVAAPAPAVAAPVRPRRAPAVAAAVTEAPAPAMGALTRAQKAAQTRKARLASGTATPVDWVAAGRKAWETRQRRAKEAA